MNESLRGRTAGPLAGVRVLEFEGLGPAPFCGMLLADMGAEVTLLERNGPSLGRLLLGHGRRRVTHRGKRSVGVDLKHPSSAALVMRLVAASDVVLEGFRPGVMERLGYGPEACMAQNPRLIYARMTGWGQTGPLASAPGHDLNFAALSGALSTGRHHGNAPWAPPTLVGDMGGGGMLLAFGIACALFEARRSGQGQVIDAAMAEGAALLTHGHHALLAERDNQPGAARLLDSTAPFYDVYRCRDGRWLALASLEPAFFANLAECLGFAGEAAFAPGAQFNEAHWPRMRELLETTFASQDRDHWSRLLEGSACCVSPVLELDEAPGHPQHQARGAFLDLAGVSQPAPAPRLSRTPARVNSAPPLLGEHTRACLEDLGMEAGEIEALITSGALQAAEETP